MSERVLWIGANKDSRSIQKGDDDETNICRESHGDRFGSARRKCSGFRDMLEEQGENGVTDPVSGPVVLALK